MAKRHSNWVITPDKFFEVDEIQKIYELLMRRRETDARRNYINMFLVDMLLGTGLRAAELCSLRIDQTPVVFTVDKIWIQGKGKKTRIITIRPELSDAIRDYVANIRPSLLPRKIKRSDTTAPLLFTEYGHPFNRRLLYDRLRRIGIKAGILKTVGPHKFRHTYATTFVRETHDILALQGQMGHSSVNTTAVYAKVDDGRLGSMLSNIGTFNVGTVLCNLRRVKPLKDRNLKTG